LLAGKDLKCQEMLNVEIVFDQKNIPEKFIFSFDDKVINSGADVLFPIRKAIDYEGFVQFKSEYAILTYHISYENPDEKKVIDSADVFPVKSLNGKRDFVALADLWDTRELFTKGVKRKEKSLAARFLIPLIEKKNGDYVFVEYACTNWHDLREIDSSDSVEK
jgi:hypothetical protein